MIEDSNQGTMEDRRRKLSGALTRRSSRSDRESSVASLDESKRLGERRKSWPHTVQEHESRHGEFIRGEAQPEDGLGSTVKVMEASFSAADSSLEAAQHSEQPKQVVSWDPLPNETTSTHDTIWNSSQMDKSEIDEDELLKIVSQFKMSRSYSRRSIAIVATKSKRESVLDHRRATTVSVAMRRMKLQPSKFGKLAWALRDMNEAYLTPTAVEILNKSNMWPSPSEIEALKERVRDGHELADPDALLWFLATSVPDTAARCSALAFRYEFDEIIGEMIKATSLIKAASLEVCTSELLKRLMRVILLVGNTINETYGGSTAWGISISSLSKLSIIKAADKSLSVLDCIVEYLDQMAPETFEVSDDCTCTPSASKYSIAGGAKMIKDARRGLESVKKIKAMERFYVKAVKRLDDIEKDLGLAQEAFDRCLDHFCIPRGSMETSEFFHLLAEFFNEFDKAIAALEIRQKQAAHAKMRSGLMNPSFMKQRRESTMALNLQTSATLYVPKQKTGKIHRPSIFGTTLTSSRG